MPQGATRIAAHVCGALLEQLCVNGALQEICKADVGFSLPKPGAISSEAEHWKPYPVLIYTDEATRTIVAAPAKHLASRLLPNKKSPRHQDSAVRVVHHLFGH